MSRMTWGVGAQPDGTAPAVPLRRVILGAAVALLAMTGVALMAGAGEARAAGGWWHPPKSLTWYWQLTGTVNNSEAVAAYDIDGFENSAADVSALQAQGKHVICYIDVGTGENWRPDYSKFPASVLGGSNGWPGERWLDIRQLGVLEPIMTARFEMCREKGFDAVEPDLIEAYANTSGFPLTAQEQLTYDEWVAEEVHSLGMAVLQKNDGEQTPQLLSHFDGALTEQCNQYEECAYFKPYLEAGEPVLNAEYALTTSKFCSADNAAGIMGARYNLALDGTRFEPCFTSGETEGPPTITKRSPTKGPAAGQTSVAITGTGFIGVTAVKFGSADAASFTVSSATSITAVSPAGTTGTVDLSVTTSHGASAITSKDHFTFGAPTVTRVAPGGGSTAGGTTVTVTGSGFGLGTTTVFKFGKVAATAVDCTSTTQCTMLSPAAAKAAAADVRAMVSRKTSKRHPPADRFTYS